jgi:hypothetical protein
LRGEVSVSVSTLFVVRVWRQCRAFRASVRRVEDEDTRWFETADAVASYLESSTPLDDITVPAESEVRGGDR